MKAVRLVAAAVGALVGSASASALAQQVGGVLVPPIQQPGGGSLFPGPSSLFPTPMPPQTGGLGPRGGSHGGFHGGGHGGGFRHGFIPGLVLYPEPVVVRDVVVVHDRAPEPPAPPPPPAKPREPYVVGRTYKSLPGGCLKMVQGGASYFRCGGGWYRQVGSGYRAVSRP
ncbi:MAG TPA: hypothetical protein VF750_09245 [Sphingomicrobium sp.]